MATPTGSTGYCELGQVAVWVRHVPQRWRCRMCRKWMVRVWPQGNRLKFVTEF
jgi:hypothetical protein